jgi:ABC-type multidrug transport system fused ATPase/permease subunit
MMAVSRQYVGLGHRRGAFEERCDALRRRLRLDASEILRILRSLHLLTRAFHAQGFLLILIGSLILAWDIFVPTVGSYVIDAMAAKRPFQEVALLIVGLAALIWIPHGNLLPYLLDLVNFRRYSVPLIGRVAVQGMRLTLLNPDTPGRVATQRVTHGDAQPVLAEARDNIKSFALCVTREIPTAIRGIGIVGLLTYMVPGFVPFLLLGAAVDLALTCRMGAKLEPRFRARQEAEIVQRRLENELLSAHFGRALSGEEVARLLAPYEAAVRDRVTKEIAAETAVLGYRLKRDLVLNLTNIAAWLTGAWYVIGGGHPLGSFLFFVAWSSRAGTMFSALMNIQQELMRSRRSFTRLTEPTGLG